MISLMAASDQQEGQIPPFQLRNKLVKRHNNGEHESLNNLTDFTNNMSFPDDILEHIFTFLPIKEAINVSLVSTRFKNSWTLNRKLFFGRAFDRIVDTDCEAIEIINHVFNSHVGSEIKAFQLCFNPTGVEPTVLSWIDRVTQKGVEELELEFIRARSPFKLPCHFLPSLDRIKVLKLSYCRIILLSSSPKLRFLTTISLRKVNFSGGELIETLFSYCSFLENLELVQCKHVRQLRILAQNNELFKILKVRNCMDITKVDIDAPSLTTLHYVGNLRRFAFESNTPNLNDVVFAFAPTRGFPQFKQAEALVMNINNVELFTTTSSFLEILSSKIRNGYYSSIHLSLMNLKELQLKLDGTSFCNLYDIAIFLKNCPNLENLYIELNEFYSVCGCYWEYHQKEMLVHYHGVLNRLKTIRIRGFKFQRHEVEMVRYFLEKSVCLETLYLVFPKNGCLSILLSDLPICQHLFLSWKASPFAKIAIYEFHNDRCPIPKHYNY